MTAPIALFVYKRLSHTQRTVASLLQNDLASESSLHVFCDAAKTEADVASVAAVRDFIKQIKGFKSVEVIERASNLGLSRSIIAGVTALCDQEGEVIVLEDDLVLSPYFLRYMNDALTLYQDNPRVGSIHGYTYPVKTALPETFFMRGGDCWGWATWKRAWQHFEPDGKKLLRQLQANGESKAFNLNNSVPNIQMLEAQIAGQNDSWAIRWHASLFLRHQFTLYPGVSLVQNIGTDASGTHCHATNDYKVSLALQPIKVRAVPVIQNEQAQIAFEQYFKSLKPTWIKRFKNRVQRMLSTSTET